MATGLYRWKCGCEGVFDGLCERVTKKCEKHTAEVGSLTSHRYEPEDNGAVRVVPVTKTQFPKRVVFEDTGERRYPRFGEYFMWHGATAPILNDEHTEYYEDDPANNVWALEPHEYAIYRVVE